MDELFLPTHRGSLVPLAVRPRGTHGSAPTHRTLLDGPILQITQV